MQRAHANTVLAHLPLAPHPNSHNVRFPALRWKLSVLTPLVLWNWKGHVILVATAAPIRTQNDKKGEYTCQTNRAASA